MTKKSNPDRMRDYDRMLFAESVVSLFWAVIVERRKRGKYTIQSMADAAGIDKAKVSRDLSGAPNLKAHTMVDYGSALGVDLEIRARDRTTGAIITPSGPVEPAFLLGGSTADGARSMGQLRIESGAQLIDTVTLNDNGASLHIRAAVN